MATAGENLNASQVQFPILLVRSIFFQTTCAMECFLMCLDHFFPVSSISHCVKILITWMANIQ